MFITYIPTVMEFHDYPYVPPQPVITAQVVPVAAKPVADPVAKVIVKPVVRTTPLDEFLAQYLVREPITVEQFNMINHADALTLNRWITRLGALQIAAPFRFADFHFDVTGALREIDATADRRRVDQDQFTVAADDAGLLVHLMHRVDLQRYFAIQEHHYAATGKTPYSFWPISVMSDERPRNVLLIFDHASKVICLFDPAETWNSLLVGNEDRVDYQQFDPLFAQYFAESGYVYNWSRDWRDGRDLQKVYAKQRFDNGCYNPFSLMMVCVLLNTKNALPATALIDIITALETHYDLAYQFALGMYRAVQP